MTTEEIIMLGVVYPVMLGVGGVAVRRLWQRREDDTQALPSHGLLTYAVGDSGLPRLFAAAPTGWGTFSSLYAAMMVDKSRELFPSVESLVPELVVNVFAVGSLLGLLLFGFVFCFSRPRFLVPPSLRGGPQSVMSQGQRD